jgi:hypothetical protein
MEAKTAKTKEAGRHRRERLTASLTYCDYGDFDETIFVFVPVQKRSWEKDSGWGSGSHSRSSVPKMVMT